MLTDKYLKPPIFYIYIAIYVFITSWHRYRLQM